MGQSQSSKTERDENVRQFSEAELQCLQDALTIGLKDESFESYISNLKAHLAKSVSSEQAASLAETFHKLYKLSKPTNKVRRYLTIQVAKITHGTRENVVNYIFHTLKDETNTVPITSLKLLLSGILQCFSKHSTVETFGISMLSCKRFVKNMTLEFKQTLTMENLNKIFQESSNINDLFQSAFKVMFLGAPIFPDKEMHGFMPILIPQLEMPAKLTLNPDNTLLSVPDMIYLNNCFPLELQHKWRLLYTSNLQGESFSKLSTQIVDKGPLIIVVRDQDGYVFGGFISTNLTHSSQYQGNERSFLFGINPSYGVYNPTGYNNHFVYMNIGQETIPNGLAMGGQHNYFGLWLSTEFGKGHSKAKPTSTTYGSPQLSCKDDFLIDAVEAWGIGEEPKRDEEEEEVKRSIIDKNPDVVAILRIAGKEQASEGLRESEISPAMPETTGLHLPHDPMNYP